MKNKQTRIAFFMSPTIVCTYVRALHILSVSLSLLYGAWYLIAVQLGKISQLETKAQL